MKKIVLVMLLVIVSFSIKAQDLISGGTNSWIFHTPEDRTSLLIAPKTNSIWDWAKATQFYNNGNVSFIGSVGIGTTTPSSQHQVVVNKAGLNFVSTYINRYGTDTGGNAVGIGFLNEGVAGADWFKSGIVHERLGGYGIGTLHFLVNNSSSPTATSLADAKLSIKSNGNVGIGTTNPTHKLDVNTGGGNFKTYTYGTEYTVNIAGGWARSTRFRNENDNKTVVFGGHSGNAFINTGVDINDNPTGYLNQKFTLLANGNVGIGTTGPTQKLEVNGNVKASSFQVKKWGSAYYSDLNSNMLSFSRNGYSYINNSNANGSIAIRAGGVDNVDVLVSSNGDVGIGTTDTKGFKLGVNGRVAATEVKVASYANWADFVFEKEYQLPTLNEVENHIKEKGHLKDIPSATKVKKDGFFLGEMDAKLLQKIEELTLYTIQQEKEIQELKNQNKQLKKLAQEIALIKAKLK